MFVGHYGPSFAGKALDNRIPLWLLFLAVQFVDVLWGIFVLLGIEKVRIVPGITASSPLDLYYMPYTHSLVGGVGLEPVRVCRVPDDTQAARATNWADSGGRGFFALDPGSDRPPARYG